jgi:anti-sigma B factor antagonist
MVEATCSLAAMTHGAHGLALETVLNGEVLEVRVRGELDMSTTPQLSDALSAAAEQPASEVMLDLSGVTFIDSSALRLLVLSGRALAEAGRTLQIGPRSDMVARILTMTSLDAGSDAFTVLPQ